MKQRGEVSGQSCWRGRGIGFAAGGRGGRVGREGGRGAGFLDG